MARNINMHAPPRETRLVFNFNRWNLPLFSISHFIYARWQQLPKALPAVESSGRCARTDDYPISISIQFISFIGYLLLTSWTNQQAGVRMIALIHWFNLNRKMRILSEWLCQLFRTFFKTVAVSSVVDFGILINSKVIAVDSTYPVWLGDDIYNWR